MKKTRFFLLVILFFFLGSLSAFAVEAGDVREFVDTDSLLSHLPEEMEPEASRNFLESGDPEALLGSAAASLWKSLSLGLKESLGFFAGLISILLAGSIAASLKTSFSSKNIQSALDFLFLMILSAFTYDALQDCLETVRVSLKGIHSFMVAFLPVSTLLMSMNGAIGSAAVMKNSMNLMISSVSYVISYVLFPVLRTLFAITLVGNITGMGLSSLVAFLKRSVKILTVFFFSLVGGALGIRQALAAAGDSLAMRSVRFAAGNFIPVVGSAVGEASRTVLASLQLVKSQCGVLCLVALLFLILRPIGMIWLRKMLLQLAGAVGEMLGEKSSLSFLQAVSGLLDLLLALLFSEGVYIIFYVTLFLSAKGGSV